MQLITQTINLTMSSREIADLLDKQHGNIKISAERLADKGVIGTLAVQEFEHNGNKSICSKPPGVPVKPKRSVIFLRVPPSIYKHSRATGFSISNTRIAYGSIGHCSYGLLRYRRRPSCAIAHCKRDA